MKNKTNYIANRYVTKTTVSRIRYINGYHISKGKNIAKPFTAFYPEPGKIHKNTIEL